MLLLKGFLLAGAQSIEFLQEFLSIWNHHPQILRPGKKLQQMMFGIDHQRKHIFKAVEQLAVFSKLELLLQSLCKAHLIPMFRSFLVPTRNLPFGQDHLPHGHHLAGGNEPNGSLRAGVEFAHRVNLVSEKLNSNRIFMG